MSTSLKFTEKGHAKFKTGDYVSAVDLYGKALEGAKLQAHKIALHSNRVACFMRLKESSKVVEECNSILQLDPNHVGVLLLRAQTLFALKDYRPALIDARSLLSLNPSESLYKDLESKINLAVEAECNLNVRVDSSQKAGSFSDSLLPYTESASTQHEQFVDAPCDFKTVSNPQYQPLFTSEASKLTTSLDKLSVGEANQPSTIDFSALKSSKGNDLKSRPALKASPMKDYGARGFKFKLPTSIGGVKDQNPPVLKPIKCSASSEQQFVAFKEGYEKIRSDARFGSDLKPVKIFIEPDSMPAKQPSAKSQLQVLVKGEPLSEPARPSESSLSTVPVVSSHGSLEQEVIPAVLRAVSGTQTVSAEAVADREAQLLRQAKEAEMKRKTGSAFLQAAQERLNSNPVSVPAAPAVPAVLAVPAVPAPTAVEVVRTGEASPKKNLDFNRYNKWNQLDVSESESEEEEEAPKAMYQYKIKNLSLGKYV